MIFKFEVYNDKIKPIAPTKGFTGNRNYYECEFYFNDEWGDRERFAVFIGKNSTPTETRIKFENNVYKCKIPDNILEEEGEIYFGIHGTSVNDGKLEQRISTQLIPFDIGTGSYKPGAEAAKATAPDLWEEYRYEVVSAKDDAIAAKEGAVLAKEEAKAIVSDPKLVKTEGNQEIFGVKAFENGIITNAISSDTDDMLAVDAGCIEMMCDEYTEIYSPEGHVFIGTDKSEIIAGNNIEINSSEIYVNGKFLLNEKEIKEPLEKEDLQFDGNSVRVREVIADYVTLGGQTISCNNGYAEVDGEKLAADSTVLHKSGNEEITGVKTFTAGIKTDKIEGNVSVYGSMRLNDKEVATKKYVDDEVKKSKFDDSDVVHKSGDETIAGEKTFNGGIVVSEIKATDTGDDFKIVSNSDQGIMIVPDEHVYIDGHLDILGKYALFTDRIESASGEGINVEDTLRIYGKEVATKDDITSALDGIESALDSIIAIQESLIGGDAE